MSYTVFIYTGHGLDNFRANTPDHLVVFASGGYDTARAAFVSQVGKGPEEMGYQHAEGSSKEIAWQKAVDSDFGLDDVEYNMAMALPDTLVLNNDSGSYIESL